MNTIGGKRKILTIGPAAVDPRAESAMVPMRDGVRLATDVYLPQSPGRLPAVLIRVPYDKSGRYTFLPALADSFLDRGYALVAQDVRGKFRSEGETTQYHFEVRDGYDTLEWITSQKWSAGAVGMWGDSYYGWTQWAAVASRHPALRAIAPRVASADAGLLRLGTSPSEGILPLWFAEYCALVYLDNNMYETEIDWSIRPLASVFDDFFSRLGRRSTGFDVMVDGPGAIVPYPTGHAFHAPEVPALHSVGWFDNIGPESMRDYMTVRARGWANQYLIAEPTDHESYILDDVPITEDHDHGINEAALRRLIPRYLGPGLDFLDAFVARRRPPREIPPVRWRPGRGEWSDSETWPPLGFAPRRLYLDGDHGTDHRLVDRSPARRVDVTWTHDPDNLVPSTVKNVFAFLHEYPDESVLNRRDDVVMFRGEPVTDSLTVAGPVLLSVNLTVAAPSAHLFAKLCVVEPDGSARMIARGQTFIPSPADEHPVTVYLGHSGHVLRAGERLGVQFAASDFPNYLPWFGDERDPWQATRGKRVELTIGCGGVIPSRLEIWSR